MDIKDYQLADTTRNYYYTTDLEHDVEYKATNKADLDQAIKSGQVFSYRVEVNKFYFPGKEAAIKCNK